MLLCFCSVAKGRRNSRRRAGFEIDFGEEEILYI